MGPSIFLISSIALGGRESWGHSGAIVSHLGAHFEAIFEPLGTYFGAHFGASF